jgi:hypothetical protein
MMKEIEPVIESLPGWTSIKKANQLYNLIKETKAQVSVELGCFGLRAGLAMAAAHKEVGGMYYGIDAYDKEPCLLGIGNSDNDKYWSEMDFIGVHYEALKAVEQTGLKEWVNIIKLPTEKAASKFKEINVLYIDANFTSEETAKDIHNYAGLVTKEGYVVVNNSNWGTKRGAGKLLESYGFDIIGEDKDDDGTQWAYYQRLKIASPPKITPITKAQDRIDQVVNTLEGWSSTKQCQTLYNLVIQSKAKVSIDCGVFGGRSLFAMALAHKTLNQGKCFGIDPWSVEACLEGENPDGNDEWWANNVDFKMIFTGVLEMLIKEDLTEYSNILRFKSEEVCHLFNRIDVIFIDGNHSEELSCRDVANFAPLVVSGGFIMFDDIKWKETAKAQDLILNYGFMEIISCEDPIDGYWKVYQKMPDTTKIIEESKY